MRQRTTLDSRAAGQRGEPPIPAYDLAGKPVVAGPQAVEERAAIADEADAAPVASGRGTRAALEELQGWVSGTIPM